MVRLTVCLAMAVGFFLSMSDAMAARYTCKAARDLARLGARDWDTVVVTPDDDKKECRFSVNGEPAGSPPRDSVIASINVIRRGEAVQRLIQKDVGWLGTLLMAASPETELPKEIFQLLSMHREPLEGCFRALTDNKPGSLPRFVDNNNRPRLFCNVASGNERTVGFGDALNVNVESTIPFLVVGVRNGGRASLLFVPFGFFRGPDFR